jgi:hypothetical protein
MSIVVFLGPTLRVIDARRELDATYLPPAAAGDVYRVASQRPIAIGIIDGLFERTPSIWHKEILWAMSEGVHVFGAASMGALRAGELAPFGMEGFGEIYDSVRSGELTDDDEVAVAHAGAEHDHRPTSEAMVNIRATLARAAHVRVLSEPTAKAISFAAKRLFYADRSYERALAEAADAGVSDTEIRAFRAWLPDGRVDAKRRDAIALLQRIRARVAAGLPAKGVTYRFEHTHAWESLQRSARASSADAALSAIDEAVLDELRIGGEFVSERRAALARTLALGVARESGKPFGRAAVEATLESIRRERGLLRVEDVVAWMTENDLTPEGLEGFVRDEARFRWVESTLAGAAHGHIIDHLRMTGRYAELRRRASEKAAALAERGVDPEEPAAPVDDAALWRWYFLESRGAEHVESDLDSYASRMGFASLDGLRRAALREYLSDPARGGLSQA